MKIRLNRTRLRLAQVQAVRVVQVKAQKIANNFYSHDDPDGSYTGVSQDGSIPVQDVDDL